MIRVALCITELNIGGAERALCELAVRLDRERFEPVVYSLLPRPENIAASCVPMLENAGIDVRFLEMRSSASFLSGVCKLRRLLKSQEPHVFQSFLFHANFLGRIAARLARVPHVFSGIRVAEKDSPYRLRLDRWTCRLVDFHVCVSRSVAEFSERCAGLPKSKLVVIPNGIDARPYEKAEKADISRFESIPGSKKAIFIGRLHRQKGVDLLLEYWTKTALDGWELLIVGDGPEKDRLLLRLESSDCSKIRSKIHFLGWRPDIPELLAASDLLILPSRWEGMPNAVMQAMAAGLPVLTTVSEGVEELLGEHLVPQSWEMDNAGDFAEKLQKMVSDEKNMADLGVANRERINDRFSMQQMTEAYQELWTRYIDETARRT